MIFNSGIEEQLDLLVRIHFSQVAYRHNQRPAIGHSAPSVSPAESKIGRSSCLLPGLPPRRGPRSEEGALPAYARDMEHMNPKLARYLLYHPVVFLKGERVVKYLREYSHTQWLAPSELQSYQLRKLRRLLKFVATRVPYYRDSLSGIDLSSIADITDVAQLPCVDKSTIRDRAMLLHSKRPNLFTSVKTTGGSTGQPVSILKSPRSLAMERAATWRSYAWAGISIGDPQARFWGVPARNVDRRRRRIVEFVSNRLHLSAFRFTDAELGRYYQKLQSFRPKYLYGYVSMLIAFADYLEANCLRPPCPLKCIVTTSEVLTEPARQYLAQVFQSRVYNEYGCGEVGSIAHECEYGNMHIMSENLLVEVVRDFEHGGSQTSGEIVVTELNNFVMPLIRYRLGDYAEAAPEPCRCGRGLPVIKHIHGRAYDIITAPDGRKYHGEFFVYVFEDAKKRDLGVNQFQVVQTTVGDLTVRVVPAEHHSPLVESFIRKRIRRTTGMSVTFELVSDIAREDSGKLRLIKALEADVAA